MHGSWGNHRRGRVANARLTSDHSTLLSRHLYRTASILNQRTIMTSVNAPAPPNPELVVRRCLALSRRLQAESPQALTILTLYTDSQDQRSAHHLLCTILSRWFPADRWPFSERDGSIMSCPAGEGKPCMADGTRAQTAVTLKDRSIWLIPSSPLDPATLTTLQELAADGPGVEHLVAPDREHNIFLSQYMKAFPQAKVYVPKGVKDNWSKSSDSTLKEASSKLHFVFGMGQPDPFEASTGGEIKCVDFAHSHANEVSTLARFQQMITLTRSHRTSHSSTYRRAHLSKPISCSTCHLLSRYVSWRIFPLRYDGYVQLTFVSHAFSTRRAASDLHCLSSPTCSRRPVSVSTLQAGPTLLTCSLTIRHRSQASVVESGRQGQKVSGDLGSYLTESELTSRSLVQENGRVRQIGFCVGL